MSIVTIPHMVDILIADDNPGDVELMREAFAEAGAAHRLHVAADGEQALDYLFRRGIFTHHPRPSLIFLDWNMPRVSGLEVLEKSRPMRGCGAYR